jgi:hypothetical protein
MLFTLQLYVRDLLAYLRNDRNIRHKQLLVYIMPVLTRPVSDPLCMKELHIPVSTNSNNFIISLSLAIIRGCFINGYCAYWIGF